MKRKKTAAAVLLLCMLAGCGAQTVPEPVSETRAAEIVQTQPPETSAAPRDLPPVDIDLTRMSQTMMYSQAYDMIYNSESYLGKTVRISGPYNTFTDPETGKVHRAVLIRDATACCTQGIEFEPENADVSPAVDAEIIVSGTFDTYMDGMFLYCVLRSAQIES